MIVDTQLYFSDEQAITASGASTNILDLSAAGNIFPGEPLDVVLIPNVAADFTTGDETYSFALQGDDNAAFSSPTTLVTRAILATALAAKTQHIIPLPETSERYLRVYATLAGTTPSITFTAFLQPRSATPNTRNYPKGYSV